MHPIYRTPSPGLARLILARDFIEKTTGNPYSYSKNVMEKIGVVISWGVNSFLDISIKNITNPVVVVALTCIAAFVVTVIFYQVIAYQILITVIPIASKVEFWMIKALFVTLIQFFIMGTGIKIFGRLNNEELMTKYTAGELVPILIGAKKV